mgnify:CR=1 FL=1
MEYSYKQVQENIKENEFQIKKKFGQNFIIDKNIINNIINGSEIDKETLVVEIGPGMGALTTELVKKAKNVLCYEIDTTLKPILSKIEASNLEIIYEDFLKRNVKKDLEKYNCQKIHLVANLPYYITTPILIKVLEDQLNIDKIVVMVQKEVGDRFKAKEGSKDYSSLSILFNYHYTITKLMDISRNVFIPKPNVDSIVLTMNKKANKEYIEDIDIFYKLIRDAFKYKRKNIRNNLKDYNLTLIESILKNYGFDLNSRAEQLNYKIFIEISNKLVKE